MSDSISWNMADDERIKNLDQLDGQPKLVRWSLDGHKFHSEWDVDGETKEFFANFSFDPPEALLGNPNVWNTAMNILKPGSASTEVISYPVPSEVAA
jgi:hypothetical protein